MSLKNHRFRRNAVGLILLVSALSVSAQEDGRDGNSPLSGGDVVIREEPPEQEVGFLESTGVAVRLGTTGIGLNVAYRALPWLTGRLDAGYMPKLSIEVSEFRASFDSWTVGVVGDLFPWQDDAFRVSAGVAYTQRSISLEYGDVSGGVDFQPLAGYVGLGFGNVAAEQGLIGVVFDVGVLLSMATVDAQAAEALAQYGLLSNGSAEYELLLPWPVLSLGLAIRPGR